MGNTGNGLLNYWKAIRLYINKPHVENRRLAGIVKIACFQLADIVSKEKQRQVSIDLKSLETENLSADILFNFLTDRGIIIRKSTDTFLSETIKRVDNSVTGFIVVNKLLAKNLNKFSSCYEMVILGKFQFVRSLKQLQSLLTALMINRHSCCYHHIHWICNGS